MPRERIRRYSWQRKARPRKWSPLLFSSAPVASHSAQKTGGSKTIRAHLSELRAQEAATMELPGNVKEA
jgi:hypothetical protein